MQQINTPDDIYAFSQQLKAEGKRVALVPTMGALHAGHMALVEEARGQADAVILSIYVNPKQFGAGEDLDRYPRTLEADKALCEQYGVVAVYAPTSDVMYPDGFATLLSVSGMSEGLCGQMRPGHFDGVALVVAKLLLQIMPDVALFGEKDFQQLQVIKRMVADLNIPVAIEGVPTVREEDGLALSSRNRYLSEEQRAIASALYRALQGAAESIRQGQEVKPVLADAVKVIEAAGFDRVQYMEMRDEEAFSKAALHYDAGRRYRILAAVYLGNTRLIDNIAV